MDHTQNISKVPLFDGKYKTIISFPSNEKDIEKFTYVNEGASKKSVDVKFLDNNVYMAFEDENDALIFKIKYL